MKTRKDINFVTVMLVLSILASAIAKGFDDWHKNQLLEPAELLAQVDGRFMIYDGMPGEDAEMDDC